MASNNLCKLLCCFPKRKESSQQDMSSSTKHPQSNPNPASYWSLALRAKGLRAAAAVGLGIHHYAPPVVPSPTRTKWIDATLGDKKGKRVIRLDIYSPEQVKDEDTNRPGVIIFHGGGFVLGYGTDDARWAVGINKQLGAVAIAVSYRLSPENPFPTAVEDCATAILHVANNASYYGFDPTKLFVSGFSAGANLALTSHHLLQSPSTWGYTLPSKPPRVRGIVAFYPLLDYSLSRSQKRDSCVKPQFTLAPSLTTLFDSSYLPPSVDLSDARLSPALAPNDMINKLPPVHMTLCEYDMLYAEGISFQKRLEKEGKEVSVRVLKGERHAWDKPPPLAPKGSVQVEYEAAVAVMESWLEYKKEM
nr:hypothetical protein L204_04726 [Cryptococcus depauperatus CBS 7855]